MTIGIYKITNKKTGQMYIGKSINIEKRFKEHINGKNCPSSYIDNAIKKYGEDHFEFEIIEEFNENTPFLNDILNDKEQYYIAVYNTFENDFHYNLTIGGDGTGFGKNHPNYGNPSNYHHSEETKKKISKAQSGENNPMYGKTEKNSPFYGKKHSEETKKKISKAHIGKKHSEETKKKMSKARSGENSPVWKNYARIIKHGKTSNNKQAYAIRYQGKIIKKSISLDKLIKWFSKNYPNQELKL